MSKKNISTEEFDRIFDEGKEDIVQYLDLAKTRRPGQEPRRVNVDFPAWMVGALDREARRIGVTRQALIKMWVADRLERTPEELPAPVLVREDPKPPT